MPSSIARWMVAIASSMSTAPYIALIPATPAMPMQPRPMAETSSPWAPSLRRCMNALLTGFDLAFLRQRAVGARRHRRGDRDVHRHVAERAHDVGDRLDRDKEAERLDGHAERQADRG